ncbi:carboxylesterase [Fusarium austroafricanum]|uniref:Carboxylic ester hydrolase n=1 Tax=Fusarium austroafricanum TaxID=2364996 RepID=A0A8H4NEE7_9HYPO|nr:carboxylesterase [Fusarium austroafricanum]
MNKLPQELGLVAATMRSVNMVIGASRHDLRRDDLQTVDKDGPVNMEQISVDIRIIRAMCSLARAEDKADPSNRERLEIFRSQNSVALKEHNLGLRDIRFAIEWLRDNIAGFGGDTDLMALWGQSAGSVATDMCLSSSITDPIIKGTISSSGSVFAPPSFLSFDFAQNNFATWLIS